MKTEFSQREYNITTNWPEMVIQRRAKKLALDQYPRHPVGGCLFCAAYEGIRMFHQSFLPLFGANFWVAIPTSMDPLQDRAEKLEGVVLSRNGYMSETDLVVQSVF